MATANKRDKYILDQILVADDHPRHLGFDFIERAAGALHALFNFGNGFHDYLLAFMPPCRQLNLPCNLLKLATFPDHRRAAWFPKTRNIV
jgi:hypothetical protein